MEDKEFSSINVIPLVDIMLVLLTIVLITAAFVVQGSIPVSLPQAKGAYQENIKGLSITIKRDGSLWLGTQAVSLREMEEMLSQYSRDVSVLIFADKEATVQSLVSVLDILKRLGFKNISVRTEVQS
ncbi:ExbD/TolR family protein [Thermocrinis sp.]